MGNSTSICENQSVKPRIFKPLHSFLKYFWYILFLCGLANISFAFDESSRLIEYLTQEKNNLATNNLQEISIKEEPKTQQELTKRTEQNQIKLALITAKINNFLII